MIYHPESTYQLKFQNYIKSSDKHNNISDMYSPSI